MNLHEHMRQDHTSFIPDRSPARAKLNADVDAFLAAGGQIEYVESGISALHETGHTKTFAKDILRASKSGSSKRAAKGHGSYRQGEAWR